MMKATMAAPRLPVPSQTSSALPAAPFALAMSRLRRTPGSLSFTSSRSTSFVEGMGVPPDNSSAHGGAPARFACISERGDELLAQQLQHDEYHQREPEPAAEQPHQERPTRGRERQDFSNRKHDHLLVKRPTPMSAGLRKGRKCKGHAGLCRGGYGSFVPVGGACTCGTKSWSIAK